ncbi:MAG: glyoxylate/hydroxypyruvate reductase A [Pseudotabrizicola sp.]|uniref:2-hydroxyacid dehydrogenase n=1 Tax=Pseudotabrizicola sp. TaxID=2939647 RepID=UPI00271893BF|nr:glyoxylate/hydroxypyruvate reductase A [Pseudotabrizicola sp.]MDO8882846.1 glyoxylate/hydroxypyruvate reductase A [Pseudotabrizicola sp.]MDP2081690.1 glyoxylate/hydroxypyruvate reductase A [Pseudotabrizicola sp.]MDZ7574040.1 glyoxylate/hydroxypyruvate reductase A [Pseudotabrizicola sp.]
MLTVLFAAPDLWDEYRDVLPKALAQAGLDAQLVREAPPETVDYIIYAPSAPLQDFTPFTRAKAVLSLWAGVERIVGNATLTQPLCRMVDPSLTESMVEWVVGHTLRHHLGMDAHIVNPDHNWTPVVPPLARNRPVTVLGLGALGSACATALTGLNFPVTGWSRTARDVPGVRCLSGGDGLRAALTGAQIVVTLLPRTPDTENTLNAETLALPARGAVVLNPGRGPLIDDEALLAALNTGQIGHATLDVFRVEPLPAAHAFWAHPRVTVTPHIAADTRAESASGVIAENIRRAEAGAPLLHLVNRRTGY